MTISDAARLLGVSRATAREWADRGLIRRRNLPGGRGSAESFPAIQLADLLAFADGRGIRTPALDRAALAAGIGLRPPALLLLSADPFLTPALVRCGYDVTPADSCFMGGLHLGRRRFDAAILDAGIEGWRGLHEWLTFHAGWVALGVLTPEDQAAAGPLCWQKPVDASRVAAELLADLRARAALPRARRHE